MNQHHGKTWVPLTKVGEKLDISAALTRAAENLLTVRCALMMLAALLLSQAELPGGARPFCAALAGALFLAGEPLLPVWIGYSVAILLRWTPVTWLAGWPLASCVLIEALRPLRCSGRIPGAAIGVTLTSLLPLPFLTYRMDLALAFISSGLLAGILTPVFYRGYTALCGTCRTMSADERLCVLLMGAGICLGAEWISGKWIEMHWVFSSMVSLCVAYAGGAGLGLPCGLFLGLFLKFSNAGAAMEMAGVLCAMALVCGLMRGAPRIWVMMACGASSALGLFVIGGAEEMAHLLPSFLLGAILFLALPKKMLDALKARLEEGDIETCAGAAPRILQAGAQAMADMARALGGRNEMDEMLPVEMLACRLCSGCARQQECWDAKCAQSLALMDELLRGCGSEQAALEAAQSARNAGCIRWSEAADMAAGLIESRRAQEKERRRMHQTREWALEQLRSQAGALEEMGEKMEAEEEEAERVRRQLMREIPSLQGRPGAMSAAVLEGRVHVWLDDAAVCGAGEKMQSVLSRVLGRPMEWMDTPRNMGWHLYVSRPRFSLEMGKAQRPMEGEEVCGDSVLCQRLDGGRALIALSDGMGSGKRAREESRSALDILSGALRAGYQHQEALKTVNTLMMACRGEESFATMDVCVLNLDSGEAVLEKLGACPTFLLRHGKCRRMGQSTLPVGILEAVHPRAISARLEKDDVVLMVSDGVTDAFGGEDVQLLRALGGLLTGEVPQPQRLAETLLHRALERSRGEAADDMTVLAVRIV